MEKAEKIEKTEEPKTVEFPREVTTLGPERFQWPIKGQFSVLRPYSKSGDNMNLGMDLGAEIGTTVCAAADGEVQLVGTPVDEMGSSFGNYIFLYHGERNKKGLRTIYAHNSENLVKKGQKVKRGDPIARVGNTGLPFKKDGGILHFRIMELADTIDPATVLPPLK